MDALRIDLDVDESFSNVRSVILSIRPSWQWDDVRTKSLTAGITNKITGYYLKDDPDWNDMILIRRYGENTHLVIDRSAEQRNMRLLHSIGCGGALYAVLNNALAYQFIPGDTTDPTTICKPPIRELVAQEMAKLHSVDLSNNEEFDLSRPAWYGKVTKFINGIPREYSSPGKQTRWENSQYSVEKLSAEVDYIESMINQHSTSPLGFCHNDILLENVVFSQEKQRVSFIDFEYGDYNYIFFDVANHFNEYAGIETVDYSLYPTKDYQKNWLKVYLTTVKKLCGPAASELPSPDDDGALDRLTDEINLFALSSNLFWGVWALVQAENSTIDFDFLEYGFIRLAEYFRAKPLFLSPFLTAT